MNNNLLIVGAGIYADVASEIASDMGCFGRIDFVDDVRQNTPNGGRVIGTVESLSDYASDYDAIVVAIGNPEVRLSILSKVKNDAKYNIATLISPRAYVSSSADVGAGSIIEPMAVIHAGCTVSEGCIISAGAVINHASVCATGVHVDCNATVEGYATVPTKIKVPSGTVFRKD